MTSGAATVDDGREQLLTAWAERCERAGGDPAKCTSREAAYLVSALAAAVASESATRDLGRAARGWGDSFSAPVDALTCLSALREVVVGPGGTPPEGWREPWLPLSADQFNRVIDQLTREAVDAASANLRAAARTDHLTGCANRLALEEDLARAAASSRRSGLDFSVAMVDLDGLKQINDTRGHDAGDLALVALAATLQGVLRGADTLYRIGGDEFVVVTPFTDAEGAKTMLRRAEARHGPSFSWGVASLATVGPAALDHPELLISTADAALYAGRAERRNSAAAAVAAPQPTTPGAARVLARRLGSAPVSAMVAAGLVAAATALGIAIPLAAEAPSAIVPAASRPAPAASVPRIAPTTTLAPNSPATPAPSTSTPPALTAPMSSTTSPTRRSLAPPPTAPPGGSDRLTESGGRASTAAAGSSASLVAARHGSHVGATPFSHGPAAPARRTTPASPARHGLPAAHPAARRASPPDTSPSSPRAAAVTPPPPAASRPAAPPRPPSPTRAATPQRRPRSAGPAAPAGRAPVAPRPRAAAPPRPGVHRPSTKRAPALLTAFERSEGLLKQYAPVLQHPWQPLTERRPDSARLTPGREGARRGRVGLRPASRRRRHRGRAGW